MNDEAPLPAGEAEVETLFAAYRDGFDDFDEAAILSCFAFPVTIWQLGRGTVFLDREELSENVEALLGVLEREEIVRSEFEILDLALEETTGFALVDWRQEREDGEAALEFRCHYALLRDAGEAWRIALVLNA